MKLKAFEVPLAPSFLSVLSITVFVSYLSYTYFEGYFLKMKNKFTVIHSSPVKA